MPTHKTKPAASKNSNGDRVTNRKGSNTSNQGEQTELEFIPAADPKTLTPHPLNPKRHSHRQRQAFVAHHSRVGWTGAVLLNRVTGNILDGHMRREEALKKGITVPLLIGSWTEDQEKEILALTDPIGAMAEYQTEALSSLTESINSRLAAIKDRHQAESKAVLSKLTADLDAFSARVSAGDQSSVLLERSRDRKEYDRNRAAKKDKEADHQSGIYRTTMADDAIFPSSNAFGIPDLLTTSLSSCIPTTVWDRTDETITPTSLYCYSAGPNTLPDPKTRAGGCLGFFTEDFRFETCWNDPPKFAKWLVDSDFAGVLAPDFSSWTDWPLAVRLHQLYKSRWVTRYWQEAGIPVIPIVQSLGFCSLDLDENENPLPPDQSLSAHLCLRSLPEKLPVLAVQCRSKGDSTPDEFWSSWITWTKLVLTICKPEVLVIYGGVENAKNFLARLDVHRKKLKSKTRIQLLSSFISRRRKGDPK